MKEPECCHPFKHAETVTSIEKSQSIDLLEQPQPKNIEDLALDIMSRVNSFLECGRVVKNMRVVISILSYLNAFLQNRQKDKEMKWIKKISDQSSNNENEYFSSVYVPTYQSVFQTLLKNKELPFQTLKIFFLISYWENVESVIFQLDPKCWSLIWLFTKWEQKQTEKSSSLILNQDSLIKIKEQVQIKTLQLGKYNNDSVQQIEQLPIMMPQSENILEKMNQISQYDKKDRYLARLCSSKGHQQVKYKQFPKVKDLQLLQLNFDTIILVDECQTYKCEFLLFLFPLCYLLAETLTYYQKTTIKNTYIFQLYLAIIKKINKIKKCRYSQLSEHQIITNITFLIRYQSHEPKDIAKELGKFIEDHRQQMSTFIPVYYQIFVFHGLQKYQFIKNLPKQGSNQNNREKIKQKIQQIDLSCKKYNNEDI